MKDVKVIPAYHVVLSWANFFPIDMRVCARWLFLDTVLILYSIYVNSMNYLLMATSMFKAGLYFVRRNA